MERLLNSERCSQTFPYGRELERMIMLGWVYVNGKHADYDTPVRNGDVVEIHGKWEVEYRMWEDVMREVSADV